MLPGGICTFVIYVKMNDNRNMKGQSINSL